MQPTTIHLHTSFRIAPVDPRIFCRKLDWQPMISVNLGTGSAEEARNVLDFLLRSGCQGYSPIGGRDPDRAAYPAYRLTLPPKNYAFTPAI